MDIKIEGNPGTGNSYTEINIEHIENNYPSVTSVVNNYYGKRMPEQTADAPIDKAAKREMILDYVCRTRDFVRNPWRKKYRELWSDILDLPEVDAMIYDPGRQKGTDFNRNKLMHLIHYVGHDEGHGLFKEFNATRIALSFKDGAESTTRPQLGYNPEKAIRVGIDNLFKSKNYETEEK